jgi:NAD(P)-dependent dehydrogenase (short-subunit alcohol dehydrogenase family)
MQVKDKIVVVTGGASGLGLATARYLVQEKSARVAIFDANAEAGAAAAGELGPARAIFAATDVTSEESVRAAIAATVQAFGTVHVCINCAGIPSPCKILGRDGTATPLARYAQVVGVNLVGTYNVM